jgi:shikimate dehydrogenase
MNPAADVYTIGDLRRWTQVNASIKPPLKLAVCGDPVAHSASPPMHNAALEYCGIDARYTRLHLQAEELAEAFSLLAEDGFIGVNCTIPHKPAALSLVQEVDASARRADGVNTVRVRQDGQLAGYSTDGPGLSRAVEEAFGTKLGGLRVAVLGAGGGAGRAVAMQCASEGSPRLALINRSLDKIVPLRSEIVQEFPGCSVEIIGFELDALEDQLAQSDLVINCTALGMKPSDPSPVSAGMLRSEHLVLDTIYTAARTPLMLAADAAHARSSNGLPMLLHQGALSFEIWFQREAPLEVMRAALLAAAPR